MSIDEQIIRTHIERGFIGPLVLPYQLNPETELAQNVRAWLLENVPNEEHVWWYNAGMMNFMFLDVEVLIQVKLKFEINGSS